MTTITTRIIVRPFGGGEPVDLIEAQEPLQLRLDAYLDYYRGFFGSPLAVACVGDAAENLVVGWIFAVPDDFDAIELPSPHSYFEFVVLPLIADPTATGSMISATILESTKRAKRVEGRAVARIGSAWRPAGTPVRLIATDEFGAYVEALVA